MPETCEGLRLACVSLKSFALLFVKGLADVFGDSKLEHLLFLERRSDQVARGTAQHLEQEADLLVDRLWCGSLTQTIHLIARNSILVDVDGHSLVKMTGDVAEGILRERSRTIAHEIVGDDAFETPDAISPDLPHVVIAGFDLSAAFVLRTLGDGT
jgi:hypothetical protein